MVSRAPASGASSLPPDWQARLRAILHATPDHDPERWRMAGGELPAGRSPRELVGAAPHPAAVLLPVVLAEPEPILLLTVRAGHLRRHAGQVSFPGGRTDADDADPVATALRESEEEIGLARAFVDPIGFLGDHVIFSGYRITPVVGLVRPGYTLQLDAREVEAIVELPLAMALDPARYQRRERQVRDLTYTGYEIDSGEQRIWGATAGILYHLLEAWQRQAP